MYGLDSGLVDQLDYGVSLGRIKTDVLTDFILAPHYSVVYEYAADQLLERTKGLLRSGQYAPQPPIKIDVPKPSGLTRPGAILLPIDRLVYQLLVDAVAEQAEEQLDRTRVFSHVLLANDPEFRMFKPGHECWQEMETARNRWCRDRRLPFAIKADIACFFERIYQHNLMNLLRSAGCDPRCVNLLEKILLAFTEKDSHGILQGMLPSDLLGNFYLASLDSYLAICSVPSIRFVDDLYLFFPSRKEALQGLVDLCRILRDEGLNLNETKTAVVASRRLLAQETELDRMFANAKQEVLNTPMLVDDVETPYGFQSIWLTGEEVLEPDEVELEAVRQLYETIQDNSADADKIERFCLPYLSMANDDIAVGRSLSGILERPHMSKLYCSYLKRFAERDRAVSAELERIIKDDELLYEWSLMWPLAALIEVDSVARETVNQAFKILEDGRRLETLRAVAAHLCARHGNAAQRRLLKHRYDHEPSPYVKSAILFSAKYFPNDERNTCLGAWGSHSDTNSLIASAVRSSS